MRAIEAILAAVGWGYIREEEAAEVIALFDRVVSMLVRLRFPKRA